MPRAPFKSAPGSTSTSATPSRPRSRGPIKIISVQIENIDFSEAYEQSVEQRMLAQVEIQRREQNLRTTEVEAQIARTRAEGEAEAIRLRGEAEGAAIRARAEALRSNADLVQLQAVEKWDGKLPTTMVPSTALPFIDLQPAATRNRVAPSWRFHRRPSRVARRRCYFSSSAAATCREETPMLTRREYLALDGEGGRGLGVAASASSRRAGAQSGGRSRGPIPKTGERLPIVGLGSSATFSQIAGAADTEAIKAVFTAMLEQGGTVFDTAPGYGASEEVAAKAVNELGVRDRVVLGHEAQRRGPRRERGSRACARASRHVVRRVSAATRSI